MLKKKCSSCAKKVERKFSYCPHCGASFKAVQENEDFGMIGREDSGENIVEEIKLPFGIEKIMNSLIKQLGKQMESADFGNIQGMPKGIKIRVARGPLPMGQIAQQQPEARRQAPIISAQEEERRVHLPKVECKSKVKRIADTIIYEIEAPGVSSKQDVVITELASGIEIKVYSKDKCYVKFIPLKVEVLDYRVKKDNVVIELKG